MVFFCETKVVSRWFQIFQFETTFALRWFQAILEVFIPQRRFVELTVWVPLFRVAIISLFYWFWFFHPYESWPLFSGWWVVVGGGAYFLVKFWLFSKLFGSCFKIVWALFLDSEGPYLRVVSTQNIIWWPPKSTFLGEILAIFSKLVPVIWPFWGPKKSFFGLFESCFGVVQKWFRHHFRP